ncbi:MAG: hypothetical protein ASARMPREDX12_004471 [Alectoria sarmentosa]|nr:MAG: hypothetical protein ASARMPREDX12_004471 [Alectoria sarmentosa]
MASSHLTPEEAANFYQTKQPAIVATSIVFLIICNVSVLVRILSQLRLSKRLFIDDFAMVFAALCSDVIGALFLNGASDCPEKPSNAIQLTHLATTNGLGLHIYRVLLEDPNPPQHTIALFKDLFLTALLTGPYFLAIKISLLWYYRHTNVTFGIFTFAEGNIAIAAACLPIIASQWRHLFKSFQTAQNNGSGDSIVLLNPRQDIAPESTPDSIHSQNQMDGGSQESTG